MNTYARLPVTFVRGEGVWLWDDHGTRYLDALSGIGVCGLGHAHPAVAAAVSKQAATLIHTSNLYGIDNQSRLAEQLCRLAGMDRAFFCNSGAEAVEACIKLARLYGHRKGISKPAIIVAENSFHGRTMATLSATGNRKIQAGFEPLVQGFVRVPFNDIAALQHVARNSSETVAVLIEPIQGEGGIHVPDDDYLVKVYELCRQQGWLMMLDEIQTGMGRTGRWFAYQHSGIRPDVIAVAKGLGNGVPIGACLAQGDAADIFTPGNHGSTFGGNPLACAAALQVIESLEQEQLDQQAGERGRQLLSLLQQGLAGQKLVRGIRGRGLMIGIDLVCDCQQLMQMALDRQLLLSVQAGHVIRLLPPLIISADQVSQVAATVIELISEFSKLQPDLAS